MQAALPNLLPDNAISRRWCGTVLGTSVAVATFMGLSTGSEFAGRYIVGDVLGRGGMASVYRARHKELAIDVALKVVSGEAIAHQRFEREARALARLDHPGCVRIIDYGRTQRHHFLAMPLLAGRTLAAVLAECGRLPTAQACRITRAIAAALSHAHHRGVLHRDLKPENVVLVAPHGVERPVLIDFGLAHLFDDDAPLTARGMCVGSPSYLAPERFGGAPHDARADGYALGVMLYEMLAGVRPFTGNNPVDIVHAARSRPPRPLRALRSDVSPQLAAVVVRSLAADPARRFQTANELAAALDDVPVLEQLAESATKRERDEVATTLVNVIPAMPRANWIARLIGRLRFGRWRWAE